MSDKLVLNKVSKVYPSQSRGVPSVEVLTELDLLVAQGSFAALVGPSGCGKTTILRLIAGLEQPTAGTITIDGAPVQGVQRGIGMVFQAYNSFPWLTARENIAFGPMISREKSACGDIDRVVTDMLKLVGLEGFADHYPSTLSGGMRQRLALACMLATHPSLLLLDEPWAAVDTHTRMTLQDELIELWSKLDTTVCLVTHDVEEALLLADVIYVLSNRPARIQKTVVSPFRQPRSPALRQSREFIAKKMEIFEHMRTAMIGSHTDADHGV